VGSTLSATSTLRPTGHRGGLGSFAATDACQIEDLAASGTATEVDHLGAADDHRDQSSLGLHSLSRATCAAQGGIAAVRTPISGRVRTRPSRAHPVRGQHSEDQVFGR